MSSKYMEIYSDEYAMGNGNGLVSFKHKHWFWLLEIIDLTFKVRGFEAI